MASSLLPLHLHPPLAPRLQKSTPKSNSIPFQFRRNPTPNPSCSPKSPIHATQSSSSSSSGPPSSSFSWEREEIRWLREEQRWIREEQRWTREESRWNSEREALLREIANLKLRIEALERERPSVPDVVANLEALLRTMKDQVDVSSSRAPQVVTEEAEVKEMLLEDIRVLEGSGEKKSEETKKKTRKVLRKGSEGEDVRVMQEALQRLGFYSGEEDMEYASFSSGTERAVQTWQASLGSPEDGIMTSELLERLFMGLGMGNAGVNVNADQKGDFISVTERDGVNGAAVTSVTGITEIQQTVIKDTGDTEIEVSEHRVFLLGENRWEEPSRLVGRNRPINGSKAVSATKCLSCRGEGRLMCTECDGTGEPNIEPQFLEWVDEGAKCPYCEGLGYTICDVCGGKTTIQT